MRQYCAKRCGKRARRWSSPTGILICCTLVISNIWRRACALGDALFVAVNGDASTRRLKGDGRPLVPEEQRARLLAALEPVTAVIIFEADTADDLLTALQTGDLCQRR